MSVDGDQACWLFFFCGFSGPLVYGKGPMNSAQCVCASVCVSVCSFVTLSQNRLMKVKFVRGSKVTVHNFLRNIHILGKMPKSVKNGLKTGFLGLLKKLKSLFLSGNNVNESSCSSLSWFLWFCKSCLSRKIPVPRLWSNNTPGQLGLRF